MNKMYIPTNDEIAAEDSFGMLVAARLNRVGDSQIIDAAAYAAASIRGQIIQIVKEQNKHERLYSSGSKIETCVVADQILQSISKQFIKE